MKNKSEKRETESQSSHHRRWDDFLFLEKRFYSFLRLFSSVSGKDRPGEHGSVAAEDIRSTEGKIREALQRSLNFWFQIEVRNCAPIGSSTLAWKLLSIMSGCKNDY